MRIRTYLWYDLFSSRMFTIWYDLRIKTFYGNDVTFSHRENEAQDKFTTDEFGKFSLGKSIFCNVAITLWQIALIHLCFLIKVPTGRFSDKRLKRNTSILIGIQLQWFFCQTSLYQTFVVTDVTSLKPALPFTPTYLLSKNWEGKIITPNLEYGWSADTCRYRR